MNWTKALTGTTLAAVFGIGLFAALPSQAQDEILLVDGKVSRQTGHAGGTEGGMSTGEPLRVRAAMISCHSSLGEDSGRLAESNERFSNCSEAPLGQAFPAPRQYPRKEEPYSAPR